LVAIVCDGAGSAALADRGSQLVADTFLGIVQDFFGMGGKADSITRDLAREWVGKVLDALNQEAARESRDVREFACTLLGAIVAEQVCAFLQIGDGAMVVSEGSDDGWSWVFWPQHGEFANTTNFVTSPNAGDVMDFDASRRTIAELAMFSDGLENLVLHSATKTPHAPFFDAMFPVVRRGPAGLNEKLSLDLHAYLQSSRINEKTDDDKTLILATRRATDAPAENADAPAE
jgi:hypothetical protein